MHITARITFIHDFIRSSNIWLSYILNQLMYCCNKKMPTSPFCVSVLWVPSTFTFMLTYSTMRQLRSSKCVEKNFPTINVNRVILNIFQSEAFICSSIRQLHIFYDQFTIFCGLDPLRRRIHPLHLLTINDPSRKTGFVTYWAVKDFIAANIKVKILFSKYSFVIWKKCFQITQLSVHSVSVFWY